MVCVCVVDLGCGTVRTVQEFTALVMNSLVIARIVLINQEENNVTLYYDVHCLLVSYCWSLYTSITLFICISSVKKYLFIVKS